VDVLDLTCGLGVEVDEFLTAWSSGSLLVIGVQTSEERVNSGSDAVRLINSLGLVSGGVFLIQAIKSGQESAGDAVLLVEINGTLDGSVANNVTVGKVLSDNTAAGFFLLSDLIAITLCVVGVMASIIFARSAGARNLDLRGTKLRVIEEEGSLGCGFLFESYSGRSILDFETGDLAAEREEVADFLLARSRADVLDVDGICRHDCCDV